MNPEYINNNTKFIKKENFEGNLCMIGYGTVNKGLTPILENHFENIYSKTTVITADNRNEDIAESYGLDFIIEPLYKDNAYNYLKSHLIEGDCVANLSVDVDTREVIKACVDSGVTGVDTCNENKDSYMPSDPKASREEILRSRSNYRMRKDVMKLKTELEKKYGKEYPTFVTCCGANPGWVTWMFKTGLMQIATRHAIDVKNPKTQEDWKNLVKKLNIKVVHIAETDTQESCLLKKKDEVVCTWSPKGFMAEGSQSSEWGWGTHEKQIPKGAVFADDKSKEVLLLNSAGLRTNILTWTLEGQRKAYAITHNETIEFQRYFCDDKHRFTMVYAYDPAPLAKLSAIEHSGKTFNMQLNERAMCNDIISGADRLGILICYTLDNKDYSVWVGSDVDIHTARMIDPSLNNSATSLQVVAGVISGLIMGLRYPRMGIVEPCDLNYEEALEIAKPYLGNIIFEPCDWTPLKEKRPKYFDEDLDRKDVWQFKNFILV